MPKIRKDGSTLTVELTDLPFHELIPWELLGADQEDDVPLDILRERLFEFMDILESQYLAQQREMCMNVVDGLVCQARAQYVINKSVFLCERCWNGLDADHASRLDSKIDF